MKTKTAKTADLIPDPQNPRKHNEKNIRAIRSSLEQFGQVLPLVVRDGVVVGGNGTLQAMKELGWDSCAVVELDKDMAEADVRALKVALNRSAELAGWDYEVLTPIFTEMKEGGHDLADFGWDDFEVDPLFSTSPAPAGDGSGLEVRQAAEAEWKGMPEFKQDDLIYRSVIVHFANQEDLDAFVALVGQPVGPKTKYLWHPKADLDHVTHLEYKDVDEE